MQIVIDIPDEIRKSIFDGEYCGIIDKRVFDAIKHGTPLFKGHGRLIDADAITKVLRGMNVVDEKDKQSVRFATFVLENAPTIIEADKVESEEEPYKEVEV